MGMEIVVFGAGSLGSFVGGVLATAHDVTLVGREDHVRAIRSDGLTINFTADVTNQLAETMVKANDDRHAHEKTTNAWSAPTVVTPAGTTDGTTLTGDLAIVTVKSFDTETAATALATGSFDAVLSLQNGLGNEAVLARQLTCPVLAGTITYGAIQDTPGRVSCTGLGRIDLGDRTGGSSTLATHVGDAFSIAGLETRVRDDMPRRLWKKLAVNAGINAITALTETRNGAILDQPANTLAREATRECARVSRAAGIDLSNREALEAVTRVANETAANTSSMAQDVKRGRRTEIDAINGAIVDRATGYGLAVPTNRLLTSLVRTWEYGQDRR